MKKILALLSCVALAWSLHAQSQPPEGAVSGRLLDAQQQALSYANVLVYQAADSFSLSAPVQITPKWNSNNSFNLYYGNYSGYVANGLLDQGSVNFNFNSINSISLPKNWTMEVNLFARSREVYGVSTIKSMGQFTIGVQKSFLERRATIRLNVSDLFYTGVVRGSTLYQNVDEVFESKRESRVASVNFTYRFGKNTISPARRRAGGAEEEKRRASSGTG